MKSFSRKASTINTKSSAHYQREFRKRLREQGLVKKEVWIRPEYAKQLGVIEKQLRGAEGLNWSRGEQEMAKNNKVWTTQTLCEAFAEADLFKTGKASVELIDGIEPSLHLVMYEYGDLPIFLTVSGDQIIAEAVLWPISAVNDINRFNDMVLRTHKYFPLSTISLDTVGDGNDYYYMFGALSANSILPNIIFEIEVLATNVIHSTEAYSEYLNIAIEA